MKLSKHDRTCLVFFGSNLRDDLESGISNGAADYLRHLNEIAALGGNPVQVLKVGTGWHFQRISEFWQVRASLREALESGARLTVEGYKAALFCLSLSAKLRRVSADRVEFLIHDAGSQAHMRLVEFWLRRGNPRFIHSLYRVCLDWFIESTVLRNQSVIVVSAMESAKIWFTKKIEIRPPSGMQVSSVSTKDQVVTNDQDVVLYANLGVPHLRQSVLENLRALSRGRHQISKRLVVIGRQQLSPRLLRLAERAFAGGVLDLRFTDALQHTLANAGSVWLPDLVGSGVKNRSLDALRFGKRIIATQVAMEGIELTGNGGEFDERVALYGSANELTKVIE